MTQSVQDAQDTATDVQKMSQYEDSPKGVQNLLCKSRNATLARRRMSVPWQAGEERGSCGHAGANDILWECEFWLVLLWEDVFLPEVCDCTSLSGSLRKWLVEQEPCRGCCSGARRCWAAARTFGLFIKAPVQVAQPHVSRGTAGRLQVLYLMQMALLAQ